MGKLNIDAAHVQEYNAAAIKWRKELLAMPTIGLEEALRAMTLRTGIRYKEMVGTLSLGAQMAPYKAGRITDNKDLELLYREAETFFGSVNLRFEPNQVANRIHGLSAATKGEEQRASETAKMVLFALAKDISENLNANLWSAVRNASGDTTADLFNGFDTITSAEITAGNIAAAKGNYIKLTDQLTSANTLDVLKQAVRNADRRLLGQELRVYCDYDTMYKYQDAFQAVHPATPYNTSFEQTDLEGFGGKVKFFPMTSKNGSQFIHVTTPRNMLVCTDQMSDAESVAVEHFTAFTLDFVMTMFFGVQFECIDPRRMLVIEKADAPAQNPG